MKIIYISLNFLSFNHKTAAAMDFSLIINNLGSGINIRDNMRVLFAKEL
ncbi:hypothetical protein CRC_02563 [Cylindrospermopsis raciborskii CS-505]|nr:hypothetical protein CRC_02563 [Cylindrospermopsis raciborskii CS-505]